MYTYGFIYYIYIYMRISACRYSRSMCQAGLKRRWNTRKLVKGGQKSKDPLLAITLIATRCKRLPNIVTFMRVRVRESRRGCPKICHCRGPFGSDNIRKTDHPRFHKVCWTQLSMYSMSTHSVGKLDLHAILFDHPSTSLTISFLRLSWMILRKSLSFSKRHYLIRILIA